MKISTYDTCKFWYVEESFLNDLVLRFEHNLHDGEHKVKYACKSFLKIEKHYVNLNSLGKFTEVQRI